MILASLYFFVGLEGGGGVAGLGTPSQPKEGRTPEGFGRGATPPKTSGSSPNCARSIVALTSGSLPPLSCEAVGGGGGMGGRLSVSLNDKPGSVSFVLATASLGRDGGGGGGGGGAKNIDGLEGAEGFAGGGVDVGLGTEVGTEEAWGTESGFCSASLNI